MSQRRWETTAREEQRNNLRPKETVTRVTGLISSLEEKELKPGERGRGLRRRRWCSLSQRLESKQGRRLQVSSGAVFVSMKVKRNYI